jgi:integrase
VPTLLFLSLFSRRVFFDRVRILADHRGVAANATQTRVSHYLRDLERAGLIGAGTTLHGLRISYAAWWKRTGGANNSEVADLLGDKSERMGKHYTRHVEAEANVIRAFNRVRDAK